MRRHASAIACVVLLFLMLFSNLSPLVNLTPSRSNTSPFKPPIEAVYAAYAVTFTTSEYDGDWSNQGSITEISPSFQNMPLGASTSLGQGTYEFIVSVPAVNGRKYGLDHWTTSGSVQCMSGCSTNDAVIQVNGPGSVNAIYDRWAFSINVTPTSQTVTAGNDAYYTFTVQALSPVPNDGQVDVWDATCWSVGYSPCPDHTGLTLLGTGYVTLKKSQTSGTLYPHIRTDSGITPAQTKTITWIGYIESTSSSYWSTQDTSLTVNPVTPQKPDLIVTDISMKVNGQPVTSVNAGDTVSFCAAIKNQGTADASTFLVALWIDYPANPVLSNFYDSLSAGAVDTKCFPDTWVAIEGSHDISVKVDANDVIQESDENNNVLTKSLSQKPLIS